MSRRMQLRHTALPNEECVYPAVGPVPVAQKDSAEARQQDEQRRLSTVRTIHNANFREYVFVTKTDSDQVIPDNYRRAYLAIQNRGTNAIFLGFGRKASSDLFRLVAGGFYEPYIAPTSSLHILGVAAGDNVVIIEGNY